MTINSNWASNVFKGRIGEAIAEAVLFEFGYQVDRVGREYQMLGGKSVSEIERYTPDLLVSHPQRSGTRRIEVKTRSARPMSILIDKTRLDGMLKYFPDAILVFVSTYNGSLNCTSIDKLNPGKENFYSDDYYEFNLLTNDWEPIWSYFPLVKPGERLTKLWNTLKDYLHNFAESRILPKKERELFEGEKEELVDYIKNNWSPRMLEFDILGPQMKTPMFLNEAWDRTRQINAFLLAIDLCGEEHIGTVEFVKTIDKVLGASGEQYITLDLQEIREGLVSQQQLLEKFDQLVRKAANSTKKNAGREFMKALSEMLPEGVGKVLLNREGTPLEDTVEIDFRTALALEQKRNCLNAKY